MDYSKRRDSVLTDLEAKYGINYCFMGTVQKESGHG